MGRSRLGGSGGEIRFVLGDGARSARPEGWRRHSRRLPGRAGRRNRRRRYRTGVRTTDGTGCPTDHRPTGRPTRRGWPANSKPSSPSPVQAMRSRRVQEKCKLPCAAPRTTSPTPCATSKNRRNGQRSGRRAWKPARCAGDRPGRTALPPAPDPVSPEQRMKVLHMLNQGKITVEQAEQLLAALGGKGTST